LSNLNFNSAAFKKLVESPQGKVGRHVREKTDELTKFMRDEAFEITKQRVPKQKFENMIDNVPTSGSTRVIALHDQVDSRAPGKKGKGGRKKSITQYLAEKAIREKGDSWVTRAFKKQGYFKRGT
jgi:hypothetical protein